MYEHNNARALEIYRYFTLLWRGNELELHIGTIGRQLIVNQFVALQKNQISGDHFNLSIMVFKYTAKDIFSATIYETHYMI